MPLHSLWLPKPNGEGAILGGSRGSSVRSELSVIYSRPFPGDSCEDVLQVRAQGKLQDVCASGRCVTSGCSVSWGTLPTQGSIVPLC